MASREEEEGSPQVKTKTKTKTKKKKASSSILAVPSSNNRRRRQGSTTGGGESGSTAPRLSNDRRVEPNRKRAEKERESSEEFESDHNAKDARQPDVDEVRRARAEYYSSPPEQRPQRDAITGTEAPKMPYVSETVIRERIPEETRHYSRRKTDSGKERRKRDETESRHSRPRRKARVAEEEEEYVYGRSRQATLEELSTEDEDDLPVSGSRSRYTQRRRESRPSASRRRSEPVAESFRPSHRLGAKAESRRSSYKDDTPAKGYTTRGESRRTISRDGTVYETRPFKTTRVAERVLPIPLPLRRQSEPLWRSNPGRRGSESTVEQTERIESSSRNDRPRVSRSTSVREIPSTHNMASPRRPSLQRSRTARAPSSGFLGMKVTVPEHGFGPKPKKEKEKDTVREETRDPYKDAKKHTPFLASFLPAPNLKVEAAKKVSCLTCGEDVLYLRTAKLSCNHRMCHECLRRIFTMSVSDPAHMPPKCCTDEHIPLRHVDKLFDDKFKTRWNKKYQEYTTKNRLYCPSRSCGEWIKPSQIQSDPHHPGRKFGKCKRCSTKVCTTCNGKYHPSNRECPKDPSTAAFVEVAKREGWQRCYNCSAMVELKEGCNHMTCRCTAEFCMICGLKWKSCDCPWFNYEAVENDRLQHMNIPAARVQQVRYREELEARHAQEERDEALARRLQAMGLGNGDANGTGGFMGMDHNFMQQAREVLTGNFRNAQVMATEMMRGRNGNLVPPNNVNANATVIVPPPLPHIIDDFTSANIDPNIAIPMHVVTPPTLLRTPTNASRAFNRRVVRPSERVVPARDRGIGYAEERERHRPGGNPEEAGRGTNLVGTPDPDGRERGARIEAWRAAVGD